MSSSFLFHGLKHNRLPCPYYLPGVAQTYVHWVGDTIQLVHPLLPASPALSLSQHQGLFHESALHIRCLKYWSFRISLSNDYSGLISFMIDWFDLQGTLKSLFQHTIQNHQFFSAHPSLCSNSHIHTWLLEKP